MPSSGGEACILAQGSPAWRGLVTPSFRVPLGHIWRDIAVLSISLEFGVGVGEAIAPLFRQSWTLGSARGRVGLRPGASPAHADSQRQPWVTRGRPHAVFSFLYARSFKF